MEKPAGLGRWPNAPLAYLIAEVKFQRVHDFDSSMVALVDLLADEYPIEESVAFETSIEALAPGAQPNLEPLRDLRNFQSTMGVRVGRTSLAVHCTDYAGWDGGFRNQLFRVLDVLAATLKPRVLLRSSLHCVDLIVPRGDELPDDYLAPGLRPWKTKLDPIGEFEQGNIVTRFKNDDIATTLLILSRVTAQMVLPPTLNAMPLAFSPIQAKALQFLRERGRPFAIMDTDVAQENARPFILPELKAQYDEIHMRSSAVFLAATTSEAQATWRAK